MASKDKIFVVMELVTGGELFDQIVAEGPKKVGGQQHWTRDGMSFPEINMLCFGRRRMLVEETAWPSAPSASRYSEGASSPFTPLLLPACYLVCAYSLFLSVDHAHTDPAIVRSPAGARREAPLPAAGGGARALPQAGGVPPRPQARWAWAAWLGRGPDCLKRLGLGGA